MVFKFCAAVAMLLVLAGTIRAADEKSFRDTFNVDEKNLASTGRNPFFILEVGYELVLEGKEDGKDARLTVSVLNETKKIGNVETRIVEEKIINLKDNSVIEDSRNYFAIDTTTGDVYYFGEDVGGAWTAGVDGAKFGLVMPGKPKVGDRFYHELAKNAQDRSEIVSISETVTTSAGTFKDCIKTEETSPLEPKNKEYKWFAPGIGLIVDDEFKLVKHSAVK